MKLIVVDDQIQGGAKAFEIFTNALANGAKTFGLATGSSPIILYQNLVQSNVNLNECTSINLDEYVGLSPDNEQSYHYFMQEHLFKDKPFKHSYLPNGLTDDIDQEVANYEQIIKENPIDLQLLGVGRNGHIAFNEPGTPFTSTTHKVDLTPSTIQANARFFADESQVPKQAICMGIADIMAAKQILLLAYGEKKRFAIKALMEGEVTPEIPVSVLQRHKDVTIICDQQAAQDLT